MSHQNSINSNDDYDLVDITEIEINYDGEILEMAYESEDEVAETITISKNEFLLLSELAKKPEPMPETITLPMNEFNRLCKLAEIGEAMTRIAMKDETPQVIGEDFSPECGKDMPCLKRRGRGRPRKTAKKTKGQISSQRSVRLAD